MMPLSIKKFLYTIYSISNMHLQQRSYVISFYLNHRRITYKYTSMTIFSLQFQFRHPLFPFHPKTTNLYIFFRFKIIKLIYLRYRKVIPVKRSNFIRLHFLNPTFMKLIISVLRVKINSRIFISKSILA